MKKLVALIIALPRLAWAETSSPEPWADDALSDVIDSSLAPTPPPSVDTTYDEGPAPAAPEAAPPAPASPLSHGAEVDVASRYVWRGLAFSKHPVLQPNAHVTDYGATLILAGNAYLGTEAGVQDKLSELDVMGNYAFSFGATTFTPSIGAFFFAEAPTTAELGATLSQDLDILVLQTRQALDIGDNPGGWYGDIGMMRSQKLGSRALLMATGSLAWCSGSFGRYYIDDSIAGLHLGAAQLDAAVVLNATDAIYLRLHGTASHLMDQTIRDLAPETNLLSGGLALGLAR